MQANRAPSTTMPRRAIVLALAAVGALSLAGAGANMAPLTVPTLGTAGRPAS